LLNIIGVSLIEESFKGRIGKQGNSVVIIIPHNIVRSSKELRELLKNDNKDIYGDITIKIDEKSIREQRNEKK
jgi:antitoxin component of MazEF toxin-antitoxin module